MASYVETLAEDRQRIHRALEELVQQQAKRIEELKATLDADSILLDQKILRTVVFRNLFGPGQTETLTAETETEEASKPVTEGAQQLQRETQVLQAYQEALKQLDDGINIELLGKRA